MLCLALVIAVIGSAYSASVGESRIVGGQDAAIENHPYQLSVEVNGIYICGAALTQLNVAVTTAHCSSLIRDHLDQAVVRAGSSIKESGGQTARVLTVCVHPSYHPENSTDYDIAVLQLDNTLQSSNSIRPISVVPKAFEVPDGTRGTVTGWGALHSGDISPAHLKEVDVPKLNIAQCQLLYQHTRLTKRMTCFGEKSGGKGPCYGDYGSPLVVNGELVGVTSWGFGCATPRLPWVFTNLANPLINNHINNCIKNFA